jgi:hypothetical protein
VTADFMTLKRDPSNRHGILQLTAKANIQSILEHWDPP